MNALKTGILLAVMTAVIVFVGSFWGTEGMILAFAFAIIMNVTSYWFSDKIVLKMYGARPISENEAPELFGMVRRLTAQAGIPVPKLYVIPNPMPNAFATGY